MELNIANSDTELVITPAGRFDAHECSRFRDIADEAMAANNQVCVELGSVEFIDSAGLAELVRIMRRAREQGGDVRLASPSAPVRVILELTRLDAAFEIEWATGDTNVT